ncbi:hypothetical protein E9M31_003869 [Escherichia coli]|nr:hypothetical protein [Escherichia coli]
MKDTITPLNYTKEAIKDLSVMEKGLRSNAPLTSYIMRQVIDMLDSSVKFILPNCCDIIEPEESILNTYIDGGVFILPVSWSDDLKIWILGVGGMFFPYNNKLTKYEPDRTLPASRLVIDTLKENGVAKYNAAHFKAEPFITSMEFKDDLIKQVGSIERLYAQIIMDTRDELQAFIQACSVLNCENVCPVTLSTKPERKFINGRKVQPPEKNKRPSYTYKVLQLSETKVQSNHTGTGKSGGTKRMHLRRGHIRRKNNKLIWIRPAMINANSRAGIVDKDYQINIRKEENKP